MAKLQCYRIYDETGRQYASDIWAESAEAAVAQVVEIMMYDDFDYNMPEFVAKLTYDYFCISEDISDFVCACSEQEARDEFRHRHPDLPASAEIIIKPNQMAFEVNDPD